MLNVWCATFAWDIWQAVDWLEDDVRAPTGEVCLLFTDVEGSTQLWEASPRAMADALALHNRLLRALLVVHQGYEVKTEGDAFMVAFEHPAQAVAWCAEAQLALAEADWPPLLETLGGPTGLSVRMGGHLGRPTCQVDPVTGRMDYFGPVVNRAARVGSAGHGGQIVVTRAVADGAVGCGGVSFVPLGRHGLRGLRQPAELVMVVPDALSTRRFAPLRTTSARRDNLERELPALVGRDSERAAIHAALAARHRLVTLVGPGGAGKTLLARHVAADHLARVGPPGGVWWVDLVHALDEIDLLQGVCSALGLPIPVGGTLAVRSRVLAESLRGRGPLVLVLDNVEQVLGPVAELVGGLGRHAPGVLVMATSRVQLGLAKEQAIEVGALDDAAAVDLLVRRARSEAPGFVLSPADRPLARQLVRQLDGWPLAIELAAARLGTLSIAQVLARMSQRFRLLRHRGRSGRQATLEAAIQWSWDLQSAAARFALASLTVFRGPFTVADAEAVVALPLDAPWLDELIDELTRHNLLRRLASDPGPRFDFYVSVRAFAEQRRKELVSAERHQEQLGEHARWAARWGVLGALWTDTVARHAELAATAPQHRSDLAAALEWAVEARKVRLAGQLALGLGHIHLMHGPLDDGLQPVQRLLEQPVLPADLAHELRLYEAMLMCRVGRADDALAVLGEVDLDALADQPHQGLRVLLSAFDAARRTGDIRQAGVHLDAALAMLDRHPDVPDVLAGHVHNQAGIWMSHRARYGDGEAHYHQALRLYRQAGLHQALGRTALNLGGDLATRGRVQDARKLFSEAVQVARRTGDARFTAYANLNAALLELRHGSMERAWELAVDGERHARQVGDVFAQVSARMNQGLCHRSQGRTPEALDALREALAGFEAAGSEYWRAYTQLEMAHVHLRRGELALAETGMAAARSFWEREDDPGALARLAYAEALMGQVRQPGPDSEASLLAARSLCLDTEQVLEAVMALTDAARAAWRRGDVDTAEARFEQVLDEAGEAELWRQWVGTRNNLGILFGQRGQPARAAEHFGAAVRKARQIEHRPLLAVALSNLAEALLEQPSPALDRVAELVEEAAHINDALELRSRAAGLRRTQALLAERRGRLSMAIACARRARDDARAAGSSVMEVESLALLARLLGRQGEPGLARAAGLQAVRLAEEAGVSEHPSVVKALLLVDAVT